MVELSAARLATLAAAGGTTLPCSLVWNGRRCVLPCSRARLCLPISAPADRDRGRGVHAGASLCATPPWICCPSTPSTHSCPRAGGDTRLSTLPWGTARRGPAHGCWPQAPMDFGRPGHAPVYFPRAFAAAMCSPVWSAGERQAWQGGRPPCQRSAQPRVHVPAAYVTINGAPRGQGSFAGLPPACNWSLGPVLPHA